MGEVIEQDVVTNLADSALAELGRGLQQADESARQSLAIRQDDSAANNPVGWGDRSEVAAAGRRIQALLPGGAKLTSNQAMGLAQYAMLTDANPFRGEVYGFEQGGQLKLIDGYKLLVRWAKRQCEFTEKFTTLTAEELSAHGLTAEAVAAKCAILRDDKKEEVRFFVSCGATFAEAIEQSSVTAIGVVRAAEMNGKFGAVNPPNGWSWLQVAQKRALKNALNRAYGMPSPKEINAMSAPIDASLSFHGRVDLIRGAIEQGID
jgi:hypothetical protein